LSLSGTTSTGIEGGLFYTELDEPYLTQNISRLVLGIWRFVRRKPDVTTNHADVFCERMNILLETIVVFAPASPGVDGFPFMADDFFLMTGRRERFPQG
jgi:hypothetical protein